MELRVPAVAAVLLGCLLSFIARAEHAGEPITSGTMGKSGQHEQTDEYRKNIAFNRRFLERASRIGDTEIKDEETPSGWGSFRFVFPNEYYGSDFELCLPREKGAYLGVGTIRALNAGASGRVSHLILFDFDVGTRYFNGTLLQLAAASKNRYEFMSRLFTGANHEDLVRKAIEERMSPVSFAQSLPQTSEEEVAQNWRQSGVLPSDRGKRLDYIVAYEAVHLKAALPKFDQARRLYRTFFGSDERFENLKQLVRDGKVTFVTGDLSAGKAFRDVAIALRTENIQVSAVDISNSPKYFHSSISRRAGHENFVADLKRFDFVRGGRFLFTAGALSEGRRARKGAETWNYYALSLDKLKDVEEELKRGDYLGLSDRFSEDPAFTNEQGVLYTLEGDRCPDPVGKVIAVAQKMGRKLRGVLSGVAPVDRRRDTTAP